MPGNPRFVNNANAGGQYNQQQQQQRSMNQRNNNNPYDVLP